MAYPAWKRPRRKTFLTTWGGFIQGTIIVVLAFAATYADAQNGFRGLDNSTTIYKEQ